MPVFAMLFLLLPSTVLAHPGQSIGAVSGFLHPFTGIDHLIALFGLGLWAKTTGHHAFWALPVTFLITMAFGAAIAAQTSLGFVVMAIEPAILASVIVLGALIAFAVRTGLMIAVPMISVFGVAHGAAHGATVSGDATVFGASMLLATALMLGVGIVFGTVANGLMTRVAGGAAVFGGLTLALARIGQ
jgi:urease accessory protein